MALYEGFPSIQLEGDQQRALALIPRAKALLYKVQEVKRNAAVPTFAMTERVDADATIYALSAQTTNLIRISVAADELEQLQPLPSVADSEFEGEQSVPPSPVDILSGQSRAGWLVTGPHSREHLRFFLPTPQTQRRHRLVHGLQLSRRLAVEPHPSLPEELKNPFPFAKFSQYTRLRPTMYSGKMQAVVQTLMGYGRFSESVLAGMAAAGVSQRYLREVRDRGVQIRYSYLFDRTHGITVAADGRLWLVEISRGRGVLAMPLPIIPNSNTPAFRAMYEMLGDTDITDVIDELGCLPTGESFPAQNNDLAPLITSGEVLRLLNPEDLDGFYKAQGYSELLGWAFSSDGREAHNTGYYYEDSGYQRGLWWEIRIQIGASLPGWRPNAGFGPIASASAAAFQRGDGYLYSDRTVQPTSPKYAIPFKAYSYIRGGLVSHIAHPLAPLPKIECDTVVFVAFVNNELHTVRFYLGADDNLLADEEVDGPSDGCLYDGSWTTVRRSGSRTFPPMMYTNYEDERQIAQDSVYTHTIESTPLGPLPGLFGDIVTQPNYANVFRSHLFQRVSTQSTVVGERYISAVSVPMFVREGYYMMYGESSTVESRSVMTSYDTLLDPNRGISWRCFIPGMGALQGHPDINPALCGGNCVMNSRVHAERRIVKTFRQESACSQYADSGTWLSPCQVVDHFNSTPANIPAGTTQSFSPETRSLGRLRLYMTGTEGPLTLPLTFTSAERWLDVSPDPFDLSYHQIAAYHNALGTQAVVYYTDYFHRGGELRSEGYFIIPLTVQDSTPTFIGVHRQ